MLAIPYVPPATTGFGTGGLVSGIGSCVLGLVSCYGWEMAALPALMGIAGVVLGWLGLRQVERSGGEVAGRSTAVAAIVTGATGMVLTAAAVLIGLLIFTGREA